MKKNIVLVVLTFVVTIMVIVVSLSATCIISLANGTIAVDSTISYGEWITYELDDSTMILRRDKDVNINGIRIADAVNVSW